MEQNGMVWNYYDKLLNNDSDTITPVEYQPHQDVNVTCRFLLKGMALLRMKKRVGENNRL